MTAIRVVCRSCGREVNSAEVDKQVRCTICVARGLVSQMVKRYEQAWRKREHYRSIGAPHNGLERQIGRYAVRIGQRLHERIANPQVAAEVLNALLAEARQRSAGGIVVATADLKKAQSGLLVRA